MNDTFDARLERQQTEWRKAHVVGSGGFNTPHPWLLPHSAWEQGLWPGIRSGVADSLPDYLRNHRVQKHIGANNLKSSWVLCANLYFPFRVATESRSLLADFLREHVAPEIRSVDAVELEYEEPGALHPSELLGESGGSRGSGQTSPDVAFVVNNGRGLLLTESKLAEHSFYECSARKAVEAGKRAPNPDAGRCENALAVLDDSKAQCHQAAWGRKYWERLGPVAAREEWAGLPWCPAARGGYQLFRQQALAEGIAASGKYEFVVSCVALDERNDVLARSLVKSGFAHIGDWSRLFRGRARFSVFRHQQWVAWVRSHSGTAWKEWLSWIDARYGLA